jgi:hypothetical protein
MCLLSPGLLRTYGFEYMQVRAGWLVDSDMLSNFVVTSVTNVQRMFFDLCRQRESTPSKAMHAKGLRVSPEEDASCWVPEPGATWWFAALGV